METPQLIGGFKQRFEQFVENYKSLKEDNKKLLESNKKLSLEIEQKNVEIGHLKNSTKTNELANVFLQKDGNSQHAKQAINKIVREIDNCIALLNR